MRFFVAGLLTMAACVLADAGDKIGSLHQDAECAGTAAGDLIDNKCTKIADITSINFAAPYTVCYTFLTDDCQGDPKGIEDLGLRCSTVAEWSEGRPAVICFGDTGSGGH
ncbi:hypothetical protein MGYG_06826 [Nannizzia gypsea CBS 118893]|uniref:Uncharacterized protein n=1 Tax=Arthroderma gypseum (strain ATCC MYA-4604 / CBS 118893) TaxID=535722 RepID=E4V1B2_ARTGP|nr:hypothetical protein MGYG_06826 [Nannizzia gypsea CBS 118893]EFR03827.1 hypothetical protein MGYG_06826 [Nannizzia gypsea CBS 118893]